MPHEIFEALDSKPLFGGGKSYHILVYAVRMDPASLWIQLGVSEDAGGAVVPLVARASRLTSCAAVMSALQQWLMAGVSQLDRVIVID